MSAKEPLVLRISVDPLDPFWAEVASDITDDEGPKGLVHGIRKYRRLIKDIREHLKKKLPSYSIPALYVPLKRMPLNPNSKINKPALPFPDTTQSATGALTTGKARSTKEKMRKLWPSTSKHTPPPTVRRKILDVGEHSILATRLIFEIRKTFALRNSDLGLTYKEPITPQIDFLGVPQKKPITTIEYGQDYDQLLSKLHDAYAPLPSDFATKPITVFLAGTTSFLGHLPCPGEQALARFKDGSTDRGVWDDEWVKAGRLEVLTGDLSLDNVGLGEEEWNRVAEETDAILHNSALVHWVDPYKKFRAANVISTLTAIELASTGKQKLVVFVSSTSAIDTEHYVHLSESLTDSNDQISFKYPCMNPSVQQRNKY
ncbi:male sterility protein-domain-containing protein [Armillaria borealis]|uniref:Male sterility protein-domain-containing protein n=1 Tax=Armillaria borealis TaxID=47425 RepID=A0AA39J0Q2_9AGAR|nr:male sterility protein-domain-containing protein [Armillaria borealis]